MSKSRKGIKRMIVGAIVVVFAVAVQVNGTNAGDQKAVYGELKWDKAAVDTDTGVKADSPVLLRVVEMYQYRRNDINQDGKFTKYEIMHGMGFAENHIPSIKVEGAYDTYKWYKNPSFPKGFRTEAFYADVKIDNVRLSKAILKPLAGIDHNGMPDVTKITNVNFKKPLKAKRLTDLPYDGAKKYGLVARSDGTYTSPGSDWEVGDLRVSYYALDKKTLGKFTACGILEDGVLGPGKDDAPVFLYDRKVSAEDVAKNYESDNKQVVIICMIIGILLFAWGAIAFKKNKSEPTKKSRPARK